MKRVLEALASTLFCLSVVMFQPTMVRSCGMNWLDDIFGENSACIEYLMMGGEEFASDLARGTIQTLVDLYKQNPEAFMLFIQLCGSEITNQLPQEVLFVLKQYGLVDNNAGVSDFVKFIVSWTVEQLDDGSVRIWTVRDLIQGCYAVLLQKPVSTNE